MTTDTADAPPTTTATTTLRDAIARELPALTALRRELHAAPELSHAETSTSVRIQAELARLGVAFRAGVGGPTPGTGTGVVAHLPATTAAQGPAVALRADIDALPIAERTGKPYASTNPGVMHACGHDGHTAILLGAVRVLAAMPQRPRPITLLFQPAEEDGGGANTLIRDGALGGEGAGPAGIGTPVERIYGLHGWPLLPLGVVATRPGPLLAATDDFDLTVRGVQGHAAYPHLAADPIVAGAAIVQALQTLASRRIGPVDSVICTVGRFHAGTANNIIPETARLVGTVRTLRPDTRAKVAADFRRIVEHTSAAHSCTAELDWKPGYPMTVNDAAEADRVLRTAAEAFGPSRAMLVPEPGMGGEDFSYYGQHARACFFLLGLCPPGADPSRVPQLHQAEFDFADEAIPTGVEMMVRLAVS